MPSELSQVQVEFTPEFKRNLRVLSKKYYHIRSDLQPVLERLQAGEFIGDRIAGTRYTVFKSAEQIRRILTEFDEHFG